MNESSYTFKFIYIPKCSAGFKPQGKLEWSGNQSIQTIGLVDFSFTQKIAGN